MAILSAVILLATACSGANRLAEGTSGSRGDPTGSEATLLDWGTCDNETAQAAQLECSTLAVPVDPDDPEGPTLELALARSVSSGGAGDRIGSLLMNPGGPGGSGIEALAGLAFGLPQEITDSFDVVSWDPRGVAESSPVWCLDDDRKDAQIEGDISPDTAAEFDRAIADQEELRTACETNNADVIEHMSTADVAADIDEIRVALGEEKLSFLGFSYGTAIGAAYATEYPQNVRAMVLDGAVSPGASELEMSIQQLQGFENTYNSFIAECAADSECALGPDPRATIEAVRTELDAQPLTTETKSGPRELTRELFDVGMGTALYDTSTWGMVARGIANLDEGGAEVMLALSDRMLGREQDGSWDNSGDAQIMVNCADTSERPTVKEALEASEAIKAASPTFGDTFSTSMLGCVDWPLADNPVSPFTGTGAPPLLVIGTLGDPATPWSWADEMADQLESGVLLTYEGDGHTAFTRGGSCIDDAVTEYFVDLTVPADGFSCPAQDSEVLFGGVGEFLIEELVSAGIPASVADCIAEGMIDKYGESRLELSLLQDDVEDQTDLITSLTLRCMTGG